MTREMFLTWMIKNITKDITNCQKTKKDPQPHHRGLEGFFVIFLYINHVEMHIKRGKREFMSHKEQSLSHRYM